MARKPHAAVEASRLFPTSHGFFHSEAGIFRAQYNADPAPNIILLISWESAINVKNRVYLQILLVRFNKSKK